MEYGGKWVSPKLNNGDFDYWLVINFINMDDACGRDNEGQPKYIADVRAVSPGEVGEENLRKAMDCCGIDNENPTDLTDLMKVEMLDTYGIYSPCQSFSGNNGYKVLREAKRALDMIATMFGFCMDAPKNRIGSTGWDCIKGDILAGLNK
jgi:hypothetical protein